MNDTSQRKDMRPAFRVPAAVVALLFGWAAVHKFSGDSTTPPDEGRVGQIVSGIWFSVMAMFFAWPALTGRALLPSHRRVLGRRKDPAESNSADSASYRSPPT